MALAARGAWRTPPPPLSLSKDELATALPFLCRSGAGALAWWRLRQHGLARTPAGRELHDMYLLHGFEGQVRAVQLANALARLRGAGIEPLLVKGWAIARQYPEVGLRPYSDIDLIVPSDAYDRARAALAVGPALGIVVDLHAGTEQLDSRSFEDLDARAEEAVLGHTTVRVLAPEDHLRVLSLHLLRHDACRPIWLVDLAVALESRRPTFDWARCLGTDRRRGEWVACGIGLAHRLLGADVTGTPAAARAADLPRWLVAAVLRRWNSLTACVSAHLPLGQAWPSLARDPVRLWEALALRWDRPISYTLERRRSFSRWPRWPIQAASIALRAPRIVHELRH